MLDSQTLRPTDIVATTNRIPSYFPTRLDHPNSLDDGSYVVSAYTAPPPKVPEEQKWYWVPEQRTDEVIILKFADSWGGEAGKDEEERKVSAGCVHCSPVLLMEDGREVVGDGVRESVEVRVYCFWD
jgi:GA4 desaturase